MLAATNDADNEEVMKNDRAVSKRLDKLRSAESAFFNEMTASITSLSDSGEQAGLDMQGDTAELQAER